MAESLRGGLSLGLSGFGFWSHDISGFEGTASPDLYKRWCAFGLLSSHSRLHGMESYRVPWNFDAEAVDVLRHFSKLKCRLMPYLFGAAKQASRTGVPMMRAMFLEFPDDPGAACLDQQYMLGDALLVAPVFSQEGAVDVYLPPGRWTHLLSGKERAGGWHREVHDAFSLPLYVRETTLLAIGAHDDTVAYDHADGVTLELYALGDGRSAECAVSGSGGGTLAVSARRQGKEILFTAEGTKPWRLLTVGQDVTCERKRDDAQRTGDADRGQAIAEAGPSRRLKRRVRKRLEVGGRSGIITRLGDVIRPTLGCPRETAEYCAVLAPGQGNARLWSRFQHSPKIGGFL